MYFNCPLSFSYGTESWQAIINMCIVKKSLQIREAGIAALAALCDAYYSNDQFIKSNDELVAHYLKGCENDLEENIRMGFVLALGAFPKFMIRSNFNRIVVTLMTQALTPALQAGVLGKEIDNRQTENTLTANWAESRRDSIKALGNVIETIGFDEMSSEVLDKVFECLLLGLQEYTIDDRGDIGAWVRESAMNGRSSVQTKFRQPFHVGKRICLSSSLHIAHDQSERFAETTNCSLGYVGFGTAGCRKH